MPLTTLQTRANNACELCAATSDLSVFAVGPTLDGTAMTAALLCPTCFAQIEGEMDTNHWPLFIHVDVVRAYSCAGARMADVGPIVR